LGQNVDVQLRRRFDLIPNLVNSSRGLRDYERKVANRGGPPPTEMTATPPGQAGLTPAPAWARSPHCGALPGTSKANRFLPPTDGKFIGTPNNASPWRAAISNDIATFYNIRLEKVPDKFIALLGASETRPDGRNDFERRPVRVNLSQ